MFHCDRGKTKSTSSSTDLACTVGLDWRLTKSHMLCDSDVPRFQRTLLKILYRNYLIRKQLIKSEKYSIFGKHIQKFYNHSAYRPKFRIFSYNSFVRSFMCIKDVFSKNLCTSVPGQLGNLATWQHGNLANWQIGNFWQLSATFSLDGLMPRRSHLRLGDHIYPQAITSCPGHALCLTWQVKCTCNGDHIRA